MKPEHIGIGNFDEVNYVYAYCKCPLPVDYAIKWPLIKDGKLSGSRLEKRPRQKWKTASRRKWADVVERSAWRFATSGILSHWNGKQPEESVNAG